MLRSMYAGISGMKNSQTKLDIIGNNIANVNTTGYKKANINFQDMLSQTTSSAQGSTGNRGGVNAKQVGLGSQQGSINNIHTQGFTQTTNNPLDFLIDGDGMFVLGGGSVDGDDGVNVNDERYYTRSGNFSFNDDGFIINADGLYLLGTDGEAIQIPPGSQDFTVQNDGSVTYIAEAGGQPIAAGNIGVARFSNPAGLEKVGGNLYLATNNSGLMETDGDGYYTPGEDGAGTLRTGALEMSNVDLSEEFTEMITAQRSFQANTRIITTSDEILQELVNLKR
ncbi:flagellar basal body rod protein FlgG [Oceanobacillus sojae]|uniref:flagellar basal body rod protein FlgG n=1 Tax=Oceanobacillus sojae TaxID=582851 RepID=UPI000988493B|nr:flagellar basal body rod protein FlgG [Oceanobacillus sojae]MCT1903756.1 flagellar basal body rod protein FlgG [Oceanobacillus sojae]